LCNVSWRVCLRVPNGAFDVDFWDVLLWYTVNGVMFEWALLCPKLSGCLLQRHGGILVLMLRFTKRCPTWTMIMWMQPLMTQLWSSDTRYSNTRSPL
jgi:hypothetical protein